MPVMVPLAELSSLSKPFYEPSATSDVSPNQMNDSKHRNALS